MALKTQFAYESQAKVSVGLGALGVLTVLANLALVLRNFRAEMKWIEYNPQGSWFLLFLGSLGAGLVISLVGLVFGFNSAGQKRNTRSGLSWTGFFISAGAFTLALCVGILFFFTRFPVSPK